MTTYAVVYHSIARDTISQEVSFKGSKPKDADDDLHILADEPRIHIGARMIARPFGFFSP
jgi:hypothetical protein